MPYTIPPSDISELKQILNKKRLHISTKEIKNTLQLIDHSQQVFPQITQLSLLINLLHAYEHTKKKQIIILDELGEPVPPITITLGVLAEDWAGMSNSILGVIHQREGNIQYIKGFTVDFPPKTIGIVILSFILEDEEKYNRFLLKKNELLAVIREAAHGTVDKTLLLEDETIKFEIYNNTIGHIKKIYRHPDLINLIGQEGESLKFFSSRSREYLEERKISDLAMLIITNYKFQTEIREKKADIKILIKNFETQYEKLTGITFACREINFSVEEFLKTLEFIAPGYLIKHHKSFVTADGILVYRIEIVDSNEQPLHPTAIRSLEVSLKKMISFSYKEKLLPIKSIGGFEHYARAIIPFLMEELDKTKMTQVFLSVGKKTEFLINIKLIVVTQKRKRINRLIWKLEGIKGIEIFSVIPPKIYKNTIEVDILNLKITLSEFPSIQKIFESLKDILKPIFGQIRDFDEGMREIDLRILRQIVEDLKSVNPLLIREIFFNFDELYRVETSPFILSEIIKLCCYTINRLNFETEKKIIVAYKNIKHPDHPCYLKTVFVLSYSKEKKVVSKVIRHLKGLETYFTLFEWNQRSYLILILKKDNQALPEREIQYIVNDFFPLSLKNLLILNQKNFKKLDWC